MFKFEQNVEQEFYFFLQLGPGRPSAGGPRMDRRAVTSSGVVKISRLASLCGAQLGGDLTGCTEWPVLLLIQKSDGQGAPNDPDCCWSKNMTDRVHRMTWIVVDPKTWQTGCNEWPGLLLIQKRDRQGATNDPDCCWSKNVTHRVHRMTWIVVDPKTWQTGGTEWPWSIDVTDCPSETGFFWQVENEIRISWFSVKCNTKEFMCPFKKGENNKI